MRRSLITSILAIVAFWLLFPITGDGLNIITGKTAVATGGKNPAPRTNTSFEIRGRVIDSVHKKPIANASVFLSKTSSGCKTATDGTFDLPYIKPGNYLLVVSIVGFKTYTQPVSVVNGSINLPDISISAQTLALKEVTITPMSTDKREMYLDWFKYNFLGTSLFADECKILNPDIIDLDFDEPTNTLTASSSDFIEIENNALGYKVKYKLDDFNLKNRGEALQKLHYEGTYLFEEMQGTSSQQERWQKNRLDAYENSSLHFLRSALADKLEQEGFWTLRYAKYPNPLRPADSLIENKIDYFKNIKSKAPDMRDSLSWWVKKSKLPKIIDTLMLDLLHKADIVKPTDRPGFFALALSRSNYSLFISYNKKHMVRYPNEPPRIFIRAVRDLDNPQNSDNTLVAFNKAYALFDKNGVLVDLDGINNLIYSGVWARERIAELLPVDYQPPTDINQQANAKPADASPSEPAALKDGLAKVQLLSDSLSHGRPVEKMYMQFDKPWYALGDTIWFKAYLLNPNLTESGQSKIINIDIANDSNKVVKQYRLPVVNGLTWGNISLDEKDGFKTGTYTIRAYTNWMRNWGGDYFFYKTIYVAGLTENNWLINKQEKESKANGVYTANVKLQFNDAGKKPIAAEALTLQVLNGNKRLYKQAITTDKDGLMDVNFTVPKKTSGLVLVAENEKKDKRAVIPISLSHIENTDVQFLPEGGNLVAGLTAHVGFKAIGEDGKGVQVSGIISDQTQQQVATFRSIHNGMGSFDMEVKPGEIYTAKVTLPNGTTKDFVLPAIKNSGTTITIKYPAESDYLEVSVGATADMQQPGAGYFLIGRARGVVCYAAIIDFKNGNYVTRKVAKSLFPTGITHFTLMTTKYQPLNERMVFIDHRDRLKMNVKADKAVYNVRDSVGLQLMVTDSEGNPTQGTFSMAVTDDAQVKTDSLNDENIITRMLLTADLKGYTEQPGYYLSSKTPEARQALDDLLLTQGWVGYDWNELIHPPSGSFQPEKEFLVKGNVSNVFNKPVKGTDILLFSKTPSILMDTMTNKEGEFLFNRFPRVDTPIFVLKAVNKNGKSFNVHINVDEINPPDFIKPIAPATAPWYINSDSTLFNYAKNNAALMEQDYLPAGGHRLKEVKIKAKKIIKDSQNLNGSGNADVVLDEQELVKAGKKTWLQILQENIKGFKVGEWGAGWNYVQDVRYDIPPSPGVIVTNNHQWYLINDKAVKFFVDGVSITDYFHPSDMEFGSYSGAFNNITNYFNSTSAEDIKGVEVDHSGKYTFTYFVATAGKYGVQLNPDDYAYVEITTRAGHGPVLANTPGMFLYKPIPLSWPKQFYKPKYTAVDTTKNTDNLRSTIDWEPNIVTGVKGDANVSFFLPGKQSNYTLIIEGTDMNGNFGYLTRKISVEKIPEKSKQSSGSR